MNPKTILTEEGWQDVAPDCKGKDKDLLKALFFYWSLEDDDFDFRAKALGKIAALASALKTAKEVVADPAAVKYLNDMVSATKTKQSEIAKAKADAEKAKALAAKTEAMTLKKAEAEAKKQDQEEDEEEDEAGDEEEDEEEIGDSVDKLKRALQSLKTSKVPYNFIACDVKPYGLVVSKKNIKSSSQHKKELARIAGGSTRPPKFGTCRREGSKLIFEMEKPTPGLARILQKWLKNSTGVLFKVAVGGESADDEEGEGQPENKQPKEERPEPRPMLAKAPDVWHQTRRDLEANIAQLKAAIRQEFAAQGPDLIAGIDESLKKLDGILGKLDHRLAESLAKANAATDSAARQKELTNSKALLADYIRYVKAEPLIAHIDANPLGIKTNLKQTLTDSLTHMAKAIG